MRNLKKSITVEIEKIGSQNKVAKKCGISATALSQYMTGTYGADVKALENKIKIGLGLISKNTAWHIARTMDVEMVHFSFEIARERSRFFAVSEKAGSGKSACIESYSEEKKGVFVIRAREWTGSMFLAELMRVLGIGMPRGYVTMDTKINEICKYIKERSEQKLQILIDEADKLKPSALRTLIPLYNECKGILSVVIAGTENLKKEIKRGVEYSRKGYDEIDSRFGRVYMGFSGASKGDVIKICESNGVEDTNKIEEIWTKCDKIRKKIKDGDREIDIQVVADMRQLENLIIFV